MIVSDIRQIATILKTVNIHNETVSFHCIRSGNMSFSKRKSDDLFGLYRKPLSPFKRTDSRSMSKLVKRSWHALTCTTRRTSVHTLTIHLKIPSSRIRGIKQGAGNKEAILPLLRVIATKRLPGLLQGQTRNRLQ
jgi:hypothetical protein